MACSQPLRSDLASHPQQWLKLYIGVAVRTRDGRAPGKILIHERANHARFKLLLEVNNVMRKIQMLRHALRIVNVVKRAAAMLHRPIVPQFRQAALVPELHG